MSASPSALSRLLSSRLKLGLATAALAGVWAALTAWLAPWIREDASSNAAILAALLVYSALALLVSGGVAVLIGDRLFSQGWRMRLLGGAVEAAARRGMEAIDEPIAAPKSHVLGFSALVVLGAVGLFLVSEALTGGVLAEYRERGAHRVTLRGGALEDKLEVLTELGEARREERVMAALALVDPVWRDRQAPDVVRRAALSALGELVAALSGAVDTWRAEGKDGRWQELRLLELRKWLAPEVRQAWAVETGGVRADLARLGGLLRDVSFEPSLADELLRSAPPRSLSAEPDSPWVSAIQGLMELRTASALFTVGAEVRRDDLGGEALALLALATSKLAAAYHFARPDLDERTMPEFERAGLTRLVDAWLGVLAASDVNGRCAAAVALQRIRHGGATEPLIAAFDVATLQTGCEAELVALGLGRGEALGGTVLLRRRLLDAIAVLAEGNARVGKWVVDRAEAAQRGDIERELEPVLVDFGRRLGVL